MFSCSNTGKENVPCEVSVFGISRSRDAIGARMRLTKRMEKRSRNSSSISKKASIFH